MLISTITFAETTKNIVEFLNEIYNPAVEFQWLIFFKFVLNLLKTWIIHIFTLQWLFDFIN